MIEVLANLALATLVVLAVSLCVLMPLLVFAAIKDLKERGAK
jgi:hypothetical protein